MAVQNTLAGRGQEKTPLTVYLEKDAVKSQINQVVGEKNGTRFISSIVSAVQATPALQECTNQSILSAALLGEALNLSPSPQLGQFYMVPYGNKNTGCKEAQFQLGYKGYIQLAKRSGVYKKINVMSIKEGELVSYDPLEEELKVNLIEDDLVREGTPTIGYYAMFEEINGFRHSMYWSKQKMMAHADRYSQAFSAGGCTVKTRYGEKKKVSFADYEAGNYPLEDAWMYSSFWYKNFDAMAHKTMLRQLISKWGTMSIDLQTAINKDMAVLDEQTGAARYVDNDDTYEEVLQEPESVEEARTTAAGPGKASGQDKEAAAPGKAAEEPGSDSFFDE